MSALKVVLELTVLIIVGMVLLMSGVTAFSYFTDTPVPDEIIMTYGGYFLIAVVLIYRQCKLRKRNKTKS